MLYRRPLDEAVRLLLVVILLRAAAPAGAAQESLPAGDRLIETLRTLHAQQRWSELVELAPVSADGPAEVDYYRGLALAAMERWREASEAFELGQTKDPTDKRFPTEIAGVAFRQNDRRAARRHLERARKIDPDDEYLNHFTGTLYFLEGNVEAALKYWNRAGKPEVALIRQPAGLRVDRTLLDRAFSFSPVSVLDLEDLLKTRRRLELLEIFNRFELNLVPRQDRKYDVDLRCEERNGWGRSRLAGLAALLRGAPFQTIHPEFYNIAGTASNVVSMLRIDAPKRQVFLSFSAPVAREPAWRYRLYVDGRSETWDVSRSARAPALTLADIRLQTLTAGAEVQARPGGRWGWETGFSVSHRSFPGAERFGDDFSSLFAKGISLKYTLSANRELLSVPERRITAVASARWELSRFVSTPGRTSSKLQGRTEVRWSPMASGTDYLMTARFGAGTTWGVPAFDELFFLGVNRDTDLWIRGHRGTRRRKKGNSPLARDYIISNFEMDKIIHRSRLFELRISPFLDSGRGFDESGFFGSGRWLWDTGVQLKIRLRDRITVVLAYGRDLRSGRDVVHGSVAR